MRIRDLIPWGHKSHTMSVHHQEPHPIKAFQHEVNQLFDDFLHHGASGSGDGYMSWSALADVVETDKAIEFSIELPGLDDDDIEVMVTADHLSVCGEKKFERQDEAKGYYLSERHYGMVQRSIAMPPGLDPQHAKAKFRQGVLTVTVPRSEEQRAREKRIEVEVD